jgi:hypothetical protein
MKKIYILLFILFNISTYQQIFSQDAGSIIDNDNSNKIIEEAENEPQNSSYMEIWETDSKTILSIISEVRQFKKSTEDSTLQARHKEKKLNEELIQINKTYSGKPLSLKAVRVEDVTPEKKLSAYGIKQTKEIIRKLKNDPASAAFIGDGDIDNNPLLAWTIGMQLAFCEKCFAETGNFNIELEIPVPGEYGYSGYSVGIKDNSPSSENDDKLIDTKIILIVKSEEKALKFSKGQIIPVTGKIKSIAYEGSQFSEEITIRIE